jgi:hypothetical protein
MTENTSNPKQCKNDFFQYVKDIINFIAAFVLQSSTVQKNL